MLIGLSGCCLFGKEESVPLPVYPILPLPDRPELAIIGLDNLEGVKPETLTKLQQNDIKLKTHINKLEDIIKTYNNFVASR